MEIYRISPNMFNPESISTLGLVDRVTGAELTVCNEHTTVGFQNASWYKIVEEVADEVHNHLLVAFTEDSTFLNDELPDNIKLVATVIHDPTGRSRVVKYIPTLAEFRNFSVEEIVHESMLPMGIVRIMFDQLIYDLQSYFEEIPHVKWVEEYWNKNATTIGLVSELTLVEIERMLSRRSELYDMVTRYSSKEAVWEVLQGFFGRAPIRYNVGLAAHMVKNPKLLSKMSQYLVKSGYKVIGHPGRNLISSASIDHASVNPHFGCTDSPKGLALTKNWWEIVDRCNVVPFQEFSVTFMNRDTIRVNFVGQANEVTDLGVEYNISDPRIRYLNMDTIGFHEILVSMFRIGEGYDVGDHPVTICKTFNEALMVSVDGVDNKSFYLDIAATMLYSPCVIADLPESIYGIMRKEM